MGRCIVVGSVAVDEVVRLDEKLRPDAHLHGTEAGRRLGGGGANTALPLAYAGHQVMLASAVGSDDDGGWLLRELESRGVDTSHVARVQGPSTRSLVLVAPGGERTIVNLHRCSTHGLLARLEATPADVVYVRSNELDLAEPLARRLGSAIVLAHAPPITEGARPAHILVASESDLLPENLRSPWELGRRVGGESTRLVIVTRGARGAIAYREGGTFEAAAPATAVVDGTGAGDVFAAGLIHALLSGAGDEEALAAATLWGAAAIEGNGLPSRVRVLALAGGS